MDTIAEFVAALTFKADLRPLDEAEKKAKEAADRSAAAWSKLGGVISTLGKTALGASAGLFALVERSAASGHAISDMAARAGIGTTALQRLQFAATKAGAGPNELADAFKTLDRQIVGARKGAGPAAEAFRALGLSAASMVDLDVETKFGMIADALSGMTDPALKTKIALDLLGGSGDKLIPMLDGGAAGLDAMGDKAERLGQVLSEDAIAAATKFDDELESMRMQITGIVRDIGIGMIPTVRKAMEHWQDWAKVVAAFGAALAGVKIAGAAQQLTQMGFAAAGARMGIAGLVITVGALSYGLGTAMDNALGLSDALAGVGTKTGTGQRGNAMLGDLSPEDRARLGELETARGLIDRGKDIAGGSTAISRQARTAENRAAVEAEIRAINERGLVRTRGQAALLEITTKAGTGARRANDEARMGAAQTAMDKATAAGVAAFGARQGRGGGGPGFSEDIGAGEIEFDAEYGDELRRLAERYGVGQAAIDGAIKAGASSVAAGDTAFQSRNAALGRLGSSAGVDLTVKRETDPLLSQIFGDENVPDIELSSIARGAEPQVLISNITNNFEFKIDQSIDGAGDPSMVGDMSGRAIRDYFEGSIASATRTAKVNFAR